MKNFLQIRLLVMCVISVQVCLTQAARGQSLLQITSPSSGTVVEQGQIVSISYTADSSVSNIALESGIIGGAVFQPSSPGTFSLTIPATTPIEEYDVYLVGSSAGQLVVSSPITLAVDTPLTVESVQISPGTLTFDQIGDVLQLSVTGTLSNGTTALVTYSQQVTYSSTNQAVAVVDSRGNVTAVGPGHAYISVTVNGNSFNVYTNVPVAPLAVTCSSINVGTIGVPFDSPVLTAIGGVPPYTFSITNGVLPTGLSLNSANGAVTGTPLVPGTFSVGITDARGTVGASCPIVINGGPLASVSPSAINFGTLYLGQIASQPVSVANAGTTTMTLNDPFFSFIQGGDSSEFVELNLCQKSLAPGQSCTIWVWFVAGPFFHPQTATLQIQDNAPGSPQTVSLTASVIDPQIALVPGTLDFGILPVNSSTSKTLTVANPGRTALSLASIGVSGPSASEFTLTSQCGSEVEPGTSCKIIVTFVPTTKGLQLASLEFKDNARSKTQTVPLSGIGR